MTIKYDNNGFFKKQLNMFSGFADILGDSCQPFQKRCPPFQEIVNIFSINRSKIPFKPNEQYHACIDIVMA